MEEGCLCDVACVIFTSEDYLRAPCRVADALTPLREIFEGQVEDTGKILEKHDSWLPSIFKYDDLTSTIEEITLAGRTATRGRINTHRDDFF